MPKSSYQIPQPKHVRRIEPGRSFAWIDHRLLRSGFLPVMTHEEQSLYLFLSLVADRNGVSFYRKEKICDVLGLDFTPFEIARDRLIDMGLVAFKPYSALSVNGHYQVLAVEGRPPDFAAMAPVPAAPVQADPELSEPQETPDPHLTPPARPRQAPPALAPDLARLAAAFKEGLSRT
jgi:hypothetical protein